MTSGDEIGQVAYDIPFPSNTLRRIRIRLDGNNLKIFVNGYSEPVIQYTDVSNPYLSGGIALAAMAGGDPSYVRYTNVKVCQLDDPQCSQNLSTIIGPFDLPINYLGRGGFDANLFKNAFQNNFTALFDHALKQRIFRPYNGDTFTECTIPLSCYDSHNGVDFTGTGDRNVLSVSEGIVEYASEHTTDSCTSEKGGFGCVIIVYYPNQHVYGLYAHLEKIFVNNGEWVNGTTLLGEMGNTGCRDCGVHLHFGVLKPQGISSIVISKLMRKSDWQNLVAQIRPEHLIKYRPACSYKSPNGTVFSFVDPSGWGKQDEQDPWSLSKMDGGCGITSEFLWKYLLN